MTNMKQMIEAAYAEVPRITPERAQQLIGEGGPRRCCARCAGGGEERQGCTERCMFATECACFGPIPNRPATTSRSTAPGRSSSVVPWMGGSTERLIEPGMSSHVGHSNPSTGSSNCTGSLCSKRDCRERYPSPCFLLL